MRAQFRYIFRDQSGNAIENAQVHVFEDDGVTPAANMFTTATGAIAAANPLLTNDQGEAQAWLDDARRLEVVIDDNGGAAYYAGRPELLVEFDDVPETIVLPVPRGAMWGPQTLQKPPAGVRGWWAIQGGPSTAQLTQDFVRLSPIWLPDRTTFDKIACEVTVGVGGATYRTLLYESLEDYFYPGAKILDNVHDASAALNREANIALTLPAGQYWIGGKAEGGNPTMRVTSNPIVPGYIASANAFAAAGSWYGFGGPFPGSVPDPFTVGMGAIGALARVGLRIA